LQEKGKKETILLLLYEDKLVTHIPENRKCILLHYNQIYCENRESYRTHFKKGRKGKSKQGYFVSERFSQFNFKHAITVYIKQLYQHYNVPFKTLTIGDQIKDDGEDILIPLTDGICLLKYHGIDYFKSEGAESKSFDKYHESKSGLAVILSRTQKTLRMKCFHENGFERMDGESTFINPCIRLSDKEVNNLLKF